MRLFFILPNCRRESSEEALRCKAVLKLPREARGSVNSNHYRSCAAVNDGSRLVVLSGFTAATACYLCNVCHTEPTFRHTTKRRVPLTTVAVHLAARTEGIHRL